MTKKQDSGLSCFMIVMKFHGIPITKEQAENLSVLDPGQKTGEIEIIQSAKALKMNAKLCRLKIEKLKDVNLPIIAKGYNGEFFIIAKSQGDKFMILFADKTKPEVRTRIDLQRIWDGTAVIINKKGIIDREAAFSFKWFIPTILKFKKEFIQVLMAVFTVQILGILTPVMTQVVVDKVLVHRSMSTLNVLTIGIAIVYIYELVLGLAKNYVFTHTTNRIDVMLSYKLFRHLFALPLKYFESRRVGETVARVRELDSIRSFLTGTPLSSMIDLVFIIVYIVVLFMYSRMLTVIVLFSVPVYAILSAIVTPLFKKRLDEKFETGANTQSFLVESITGVQTVKSYALEPKFEKKWGELQADYVKASYRTSMVSATAGTTGQFIQKVFDLLILFFGAKAVMDGNFTVGQLVAFRMLSGRVSGPVLRLVQLWQEYQQASLSVKRIGDIFNTAPEPVLNTNITSLPKLEGRIAFDNVHFRYDPQGAEVIRGMSFEIEPGSVVGVVGRSGSGKSTISKLIQRLYIPEEGKISVDGMDISLVNPSMLRKQIGVVLQENFMFNGTVADNISIHCPTASMEQIIKCAKIAGAHDFILELPNGYDTVIGEKGMGLSGGQKQRIAIARAILNDPRILIFDEATSALDYESESIIQSNLKEICCNRTVIIIAHRLSTLKDAQKIMAIDKGQLVEYDTHEKLMEQNGLYAYLYDQQQRGEVDG
ncbi:MAG: type I secretion system permease/ATPase [Ruminococcus sp.]|uniref:peptidase domain-containing ABC transporter n=1 Tax=Ruminococcus sp. TaxID=41978 RepID=UPI001B0FC7A5|nr:type I secretion system permease/ATPase [Ruminococcus sp.]MBO7474750.1 type I secretion system permease/ATPase [Ruminococcus sp.]